MALAATVRLLASKLPLPMTLWTSGRRSAFANEAPPATAPMFTPVAVASTLAVELAETSASPDSLMLAPEPSPIVACTVGVTVM